MLAQGAGKLANTPAGFAKAVVGAGISEGVFEELPQSTQEQMMQNWALDKPLLEGVGQVFHLAAQAGAMRLGIARGLIALDPELRPSLKKAGFLSRDAREKESKKYGLKKARKAPQYSKR